MADHNKPLAVPRLPSIGGLGRTKKAKNPFDVGQSLQAFTQAIQRRPAAFTVGAPGFVNRAGANVGTGGSRAEDNAGIGDNRIGANSPIDSNSRAQANAKARTKDAQGIARTPIGI